jgi:hypothetical protein
MKDTTIYDLDSIPVVTRNWWDLENMKIYYNFFKDHEEKFENNNIS